MPTLFLRSLRYKFFKILYVSLILGLCSFSQGVTYQIDNANHAGKFTIVGSNPEILVGQITDTTLFDFWSTLVKFKKYDSTKNDLLPSTAGMLWADQNGNLKRTTFSSIPTGTVSSVGLSSTDLTISGTPITTTGTFIANLNTSGITAGTYEQLTVNSKGIATAGYNPSTTAVTRPINSTTFTPSTTKAAFLKYNIKISCTASIGSASDGKVALQHSVDGGTTWIDDGEIENSNTVTLAIALNSVTIQSGFLIGNIPANALVRMNSTTSGTTTISYIRGFETY